MAKVKARWKKPFSSSAYDIVYLDNDKYAWSKNNSNDLVSHPCSYAKLAYDEPDIWKIVGNKIMPDVFDDTLDNGNKAINKDAPKNNDGLSNCYNCNEPTKIVGGGAYNICKNSKCMWYGN